MTRVLIFGFGRAGKRHGQTLDSIGVPWGSYDPWGADAHYHRLAEALKEKWTHAVIASPPHRHLHHAYLACALGLEVLIEKPLAQVGQIVDRERLTNAYIAFNYRYHREIRRLREMLQPSFINLRARQPKGTAKFGIILDFFPHDLDIIRFLNKKAKAKITAVSVDPPQSRFEVFGYLSINNRDECRFFIDEGEWDGARLSEITLANAAGSETVDLAPDPEMFEQMWRDFLGPKEHLATVEDGLAIQTNLSEIATAVLNASLIKTANERTVIT
jgi:predicted dehydrogenase